MEFKEMNYNVLVEMSIAEIGIILGSLKRTQLDPWLTDKVQDVFNEASDKVRK